MLIILVEDCPKQVLWAKKSLKGHDVRVLTSVKEALQLAEGEGGLDVPGFGSLKREIEEKGAILLSDLFLPPRSGEKPTDQFTLRAIKHLLEQVPFLGVGLVSNYEHHVFENENILRIESLGSVADKLLANWGEEPLPQGEWSKNLEGIWEKLVQLFPGYYRFAEYDDEPWAGSVATCSDAICVMAPEQPQEEVETRSCPCVVVLDMAYSAYPAIMTGNGRVMSTQEADEIFAEGKLRRGIINALEGSERVWCDWARIHKPMSPGGILLKPYKEVVDFLRGLRD